MRLAMGASRGRIVRQMLTESLLLCRAWAEPLGLPWPSRMLNFMPRFIPSNIPRLSEVNIDWAVLVFALLDLASYGPAVWTRSGHSLHAIRLWVRRMREGARGSGYSVKTGRLRDALIVSELALAVVLMIGAGLLLRTLQDLAEGKSGLQSHPSCHRKRQSAVPQAIRRTIPIAPSPSKALSTASWAAA